MTRVIKLAAAVSAALYVTYGAALYALQDRLIYPAPGGIGPSALDAAAEEIGARSIRLKTPDGVTLLAWHLSAGAGRAVVYFHGNGEALPHNVPLYRLMARNGWDVLAVAYRGYPGSDPVPPTEAGLANDAIAAWRWAVGPGGYAPDHVVVHGRSLGGAVAAGLVEGEANPAALVLEATFADLRSVARRRAPLYPLGWMLRDRYDTRALAPRLGVPVLVLHSRHDAVIPLELSAVAIAPYIADVEVLEVDGVGHGASLPVSSPEAQRAFLAFLERAVPSPG